MAGDRLPADLPETTSVTTAEIGVRRAGGREPLRWRWNVTVLSGTITRRV